VATLAEIREEVRGSKSLSDYEAVDVLWVTFVKTANIQAGKNERQRMIVLVTTLSDAHLTAMLNSAAVNRLLDLDPSLETVLADQHEVLYPVKTAKWIRHIRDNRDRDPRAAMLSFGEILKRIRNKRAHVCPLGAGR
jgi:hypothetical protein